MPTSGWCRAPSGTSTTGQAAEQMRASCDRIVAFGTCAVYGGIPGASACVHTREEMLEAVYAPQPDHA